MKIHMLPDPLAAPAAPKKVDVVILLSMPAPEEEQDIMEEVVVDFLILPELAVVAVVEVQLQEQLMLHMGQKIM